MARMPSPWNSCPSPSMRSSTSLAKDRSAMAGSVAAVARYLRGQVFACQSTDSVLDSAFREILGLKYLQSIGGDGVSMAEEVVDGGGKGLRHLVGQRHHAAGDLDQPATGDRG